MLTIEQLKLKNPGLKEAEVEGLLYVLSTESTLTGTDLVQETGLPKESLRQFKKSISVYLKNDNEALVLNDEGRKMVKTLDPAPYAWKLLTADKLSKVDLKALGAKLETVRKKYNLSQKREYDQFFATTETSLAKALILKERGMVKRKNILLLGDDDLVSVVLGFLQDEPGFGHNKITVLDIDRDILKTIERIAADNKFKNITTQYYDVRTGTLPAVLSSYDVVMTDPPYTASGISLFLKRGLEFLNLATKPTDKYIFLCYGNSFKNPEKFLKIQEIIQQYNLLIEDKIDKFNVYYGAESIGSASSLYILRTTPATKIFDDYSDPTIYTFEDTRDEKFPYVDHMVFKVNKIPDSISKSKSAILKKLGQLCTTHKLKVVDTKITSFSKLGVTITFILSNSNLTVHTWPEYNALHIDLITCSPIYNKSKLSSTISLLFETFSIEVKNIE